MLSGDKKGQVAVWDFEKVYERTVYGEMHKALTNNLRFLGPLHDMQCASASSDGLLKASSLLFLLFLSMLLNDFCYPTVLDCEALSWCTCHYKAACRFGTRYAIIST